MDDAQKFSDQRSYKSLASHHITFDEVSKQVHHLRDVILWDIQSGFESQCQCYDLDETTFFHHLMFTKYWFIRVSSVNKKRFCLMLLEQDVPCAWTLSLLLKSIWNCRPKDAVSSHAEPTIWTSYDQTPLDHNRAAVPLEMLVEVMEADRRFFRALDSSRKAEFLSELLKIAGGPIVWAVFHKAQTIFDDYREDQLQNLLECAAVIEVQESSMKTSMPADDKSKKDQPKRKLSASGTGGDGGISYTATKDAHLHLETCLAQWASIIKSIKDSQKLEEVEMIFSDGTKQRIWKINRPKPEVTETVGYLQLLPQAVAKRILNFVPRAQLPDCARVNRYWAYLVEELKAELAARLRIDLEIEKLTEVMLRHDTINTMSMETFRTITMNTGSYSALASRQCTNKKQNYSKQPSQKSGATNIFKCVLRDTKIKLPPIRNLAELSERLDRRGAADDSLRDWCNAVLTQYNRNKDEGNLPPIRLECSAEDVGIMDFAGITFPCPLMGMSLNLPLKPPLYKDPAATPYKKNKTTNINTSKVNFSKLFKRSCKRYNLWSRDFSSLYTASKIASYKSPV
ncbi:uncharacterized protein LOC125233457 [Leguminivora glycinivorella]|uniref:uncharacterized protein LOC125233457 n=1 Tax=Leguminivora glycinivorella TaxID=1035111 RepID=UPI00200BC138|nr:uncharacterized protein LOC125233457 [Leguminivora glycinivorella]